MRPTPFDWHRTPNNRRPAPVYDWRVVLAAYALIGAFFYTFITSF